MTDTSHLVALQRNLAHEKTRLAAATKPAEIATRTVWVSQLEREIAGEYRFLGIDPIATEMSDDDLLAKLLA